MSLTHQVYEIIELVMVYEIIKLITAHEKGSYGSAKVENYSIR